MPDGNLQPTSNDPLENNQWQEKQWAQEMAYARATVAQQGAEAEQARAAAAAQAEQDNEAAEEQEDQPDADARMAARFAIAKNGERSGGAPNENGEELIEDYPELKKKADAISKKVKEEKKKMGADYFMTYFCLTLVAAMVDIVDLICDFFGFDVGIIITPIYSTMRYLGIKYANIGMTSKEHEKMALTVTLISGAISAFGLPSNTAAMFMEFAARKKIANAAAAEVKKLEGQRDKLLGPMKNQYKPGK